MSIEPEPELRGFAADAVVTAASSDAVVAAGGDADADAAKTPNARRERQRQRKATMSPKSPTTKSTGMSACCLLILTDESTEHARAPSEPALAIYAF